MSEACELAVQQMQRLAELSVDELLRFEPKPAINETEGRSGNHYRVKTYAFWDTEPFESDLYVRVKVTGKGLRSLQRYYGVETRGPDSNFAISDQHQNQVSPTWSEAAAWLVPALVVASVPILLLVAC